MRIIDPHKMVRAAMRRGCVVYTAELWANDIIEQLRQLAEATGLVMPEVVVSPYLAAYTNHIQGPGGQLHNGWPIPWRGYWQLEACDTWAFELGLLKRVQTPVAYIMEMPSKRVLDAIDGMQQTTLLWDDGLGIRHKFKRVV